MIITASLPRVAENWGRYENKHMSAVRVLIVDDTPQVRSDLRTILPLAGELDGLDIEIAGEAADGFEAIRLANELHPDVVLMDLNMPRLDGFDATREIKSHSPRTRVLVLTVHTSPEERQHAALVGADAFIEKGSQVTEIIRQIRPLR